MNAKTLERWIWPLIFGGLLVIGLGWSIENADADFGRWVVLAGALAAAAGVVMIFLRARLKDAP